MRAETDTVIVGGGLSGLVLADILDKKGLDYVLFEAKEFLGGRIRSHQSIYEGATSTFDMGPSWFWPGQHRMERLLRRFGIGVYQQYSAGRQSYENEYGDVQYGVGYASMEGSYRIDGGTHKIIESLAGELPEDRIRRGVKLSSFTDRGYIECRDSQGKLQIKARHLVFAIPPRVAAQMNFTPALPEQSVISMEGVPTWMAGQAKFIASYSSPFWRDKGLSGDVISRRGPLAEIHDATEKDSSRGILFGFVGIPPEARSDTLHIKGMSIKQLGRIFGEQALSPVSTHLQDWSLEDGISTRRDRQPARQHPNYGLSNDMQGLWEGKITLSSTETASQFGGYLEGAIEAAERAALNIFDESKKVNKAC